LPVSPAQELPGPFFGAVNFPYLVLFWACILGAWAFCHLALGPRWLGWAVAAVLNRLVLSRRGGRLSIGSLSVSGLGGRLAVTDVRYVTADGAASLVSGVVTLRWWARTVRQGFASSNGSGGGSDGGLSVPTSLFSTSAAAPSDEIGSSGIAQMADRMSPSSRGRAARPAPPPPPPCRVSVELVGLQACLLNSVETYERLVAKAAAAAGTGTDSSTQNKPVDETHSGGARTAVGSGGSRRDAIGVGDAALPSAIPSCHDGGCLHAFTPDEGCAACSSAACPR
jgi:hypothetical protein